MPLSWRRYSVIPAGLPSALISQLRSYISTSDISLLASALNIVALLLELAPETTFPEVESDLLQDIYVVAHSPLVSGAPFDSVLDFFSALVQADMQIATHVVPNLVISVDKVPKTEASQANVARCIGQVVKCQQTVAAGTIAEFAKHLKVCSTPSFVWSASNNLLQPNSKAKASQVVLSLLVMGEVGRFM